MSKQKGINRFTCPETGRPVMEVTKDQLAATLGIHGSRTARRSVERWNQGHHGAGKGDMQRPQNKANADHGWLWAYCLRYRYNDSDCRCYECVRVR